MVAVGLMQGERKLGNSGRRDPVSARNRPAATPISQVAGAIFFYVAFTEVVALVDEDDDDRR